MSNIVLSASVRQNLLSLQQTASLLATTQNDLATGNKVNSALDNPTNFFTAQSLNNRASDINNLLDAIGNGVQVLQAANTGITSLQSLVSSAQSIANQVLQSPVGYSAKSSFTVAIAGGTAQNLLGTGGGFTDATFIGNVETANTLTAYTNASGTGTVVDNNLTVPAPVTAATKLVSAANSDTLATTPVNGSQLDVNGATITFSTATTTNVQSGNNWTIGVGAGSTLTIGTVLSDIDAITGNTTNASSVNGSGQLVINTGLNNNVDFAGSSASILTDLGLSSVGPITRGGGAASTSALAGSTLLSGTATPSNTVLASQFSAGDTITVDGNVLTFVASGAASANQINVTDNVTTLLAKIDALSGNTGTASSIGGGAITLHTGTAASQLTVTSSNNAALTALGLGTGVTQAAGGAQPNLQGKTLTIGSTGGGTATSITFGTSNNQISTLNQLNAQLALNNLQASIDSLGNLTVVTSNDAASSTIGGIGGTATNVGFAFHGAAASAPVADAASQLTRAGLVTQYNNVLQQINTTAQDSSFNGIDLLNGDTLKLTFDETGKSTLSITGVTFNDAGLGLATLSAGTDFLDNTSANNVLTALDAAQTTLRSEASALGSNLSIVQIRQDFNKNLINVLQTGSSNLTLADPNEEAADSQALSTRQSIAVSALALANQSQESVLQLLR